jgi:hypothetical protein
MTRGLWGQEIIPEPPKKKVRRPQAQPIRRPVYCSESNDIVGWFRDNNPASLSECEDLKKAIKKRAKVGRYGADSHEARTGRKLLRVKGPINNVMIVSRKARSLFNKMLRNREIYLEVQRDQFGSASNTEHRQVDQGGSTGLTPP